MENNNGNPELDRFKLRVILLLITILLIFNDIELMMGMGEIRETIDKLETIIQALEVLEKIAE